MSRWNQLDFLSVLRAHQDFPLCVGVILLQPLSLYLTGEMDTSVGGRDCKTSLCKVPQLLESWHYTTLSILDVAALVPNSCIDLWSCSQD